MRLKQGEVTMTAIESAILKNIEKLPESVKNAVFLYTEFLASQYKDSNLEPEIISKKPRFAGSMKGTFVLPLPEDFDEPLEELEEYMQ
jgi:hypothetical protein